MNLADTESYSVGSIRTIIDNYMMNKDKASYDLMDEVELFDHQTIKAEVAMDMMNNLMSQGFRENEAWEVVSKEIVYQ